MELPKPKQTSLLFEPHHGTFCTFQNGVFNYYPVRVLEETDSLIRLDKTPPVLIGGVIINRKRVFEVTVPHLLRGIVHKSRELKQQNHGTNIFTSRSTGPGTDIGPTDVGGVSRDRQSNVAHSTSSDKPGPGSITEVEEDSIADQLGQGQIEALLAHLSSQEGGDWEVAEDIQPRHLDAVSSVPDSAVT